MPTSTILSSTSSDSGSKRNSNTMSSHATAKRQRASVSTKDFIPPDVTGLSKREARLVKNRAAAFLSRQRKREEFELMELRVAKLEQENARLRDLAGGKSPALTSAHSDWSPDICEIEELRTQLAAAREREAELARRLERSERVQKIKTEVYEPQISDESSSRASTPLQSPSALTPLRGILNNPKGSASLGFMVLLCALPSLLSHPSSSGTRSALQNSQSFMDNIQWDAPTIFPTAGDGTSAGLDWELDWPSSGVSSEELDMNVDGDSTWKKLEIEGENDIGLGQLGFGALDISFDTRRTSDGKLHVRVCAPSNAKHESASPTHDSSDHLLSIPTVSHSPSASNFILSPRSLPSASSDIAPSQDMHSNSLSLSLIDTDPLGPFLGAGPMTTECPHDLSGGLHFQRIRDDGTRHRVRIALKTLPQGSGECGEWEVEFR